MADSNATPETTEPDAKPGWRLRLEARLGLLDPVQIQVFRSIGTSRLFHLRGRVLEKKGTSGTTEKSSLWQNIVDTLHRFESDEIPGARLRARFQERQWETTTDSEGYFTLDLDLAEPVEPGWHEVELELVESVGRPDQRFVREEVLVPSPEAAFGVISDLDDTVIETKSTEHLEQIAILFGQSARDRVVFPGVAAFYRALVQGQDGRGNHPIFYVSRSGWNLNDLFEEFMEVNEIPPGPIFLRDLRIVEKESPTFDAKNPKLTNIELLLRTYPELPFVLIGDSGMHDPELYEEIARKHPGRVRAVYIRDVSPAERDREVREIADRLRAQGVAMLRMETVLDAAEHAGREGLIHPDRLEEIRQEVERQAGKTGASTAPRVR